MVFPARSALFNHNILNTKAISHFQANHILIRFVFPPLVEKNRITEELLLCMQYEEGAQEKIEAYSNVQKKALVDWVNSAKTEQTKADRIAKIIIMAMNGVIGYI